MPTDNIIDIADPASKVMVVDDDRSSRLLLRAIMGKMFDVATCVSGEEALATLESYKPDLILMDVEMPGMNGYETCRQIRQNGNTLPIIFVTSNQSLEEHLKAYDAGGDDLVTKPVDFHILLRKATIAIRQKAEKERLVREAKSLHEMAMSFLSNAGDGGVLLNFVRNGMTARSYEALAKYLVDAAGDFGVQCMVMLRHANIQTVLTSHGDPSHLEISILQKMSGMGRLFQFQRQFIVNYDQVSVMISNAQEDLPEKIGRTRDNIAILAETAEGLCENVAMRMESMARAEQLQIALISASSAVEKLHNNHKHLLLDTRILLQEMQDNVESTYSSLNTSSRQEATISGNMEKSINKILALLSSGNEFDNDIAMAINALRGGENSNEADLW
jgi:DNA-binding response OmpR family regulator